MDYAGEVNNTGNFFLYYFTRDCSGLAYLTAGNCFEIDKTMIPEGEDVAFGLRDYIRQGTQRGPDSTLVLHPMIMQVPRPH